MLQMFTKNVASLLHIFPQYREIVFQKDNLYTLLTAQIMLAALQPALGPGHLQHPGFEGSGSKHLHRQFKNLSIRRGKSGLKQQSQGDALQNGTALAASTFEDGPRGVDGAYIRIPNEVTNRATFPRPLFQFLVCIANGST